ncbi:hypothetical protein K438DRAFT_1139633 [Mycena galopus ATCC 62051]|nr:hypothetical protein K438DRAFT_1139633 [Mycena galopus ATCC 62051]
MITVAVAAPHAPRVVRVWLLALRTQCRAMMASTRSGAQRPIVDGSAMYSFSGRSGMEWPPPAATYWVSALEPGRRGVDARRGPPRMWRWMCKRCSMPWEMRTGVRSAMSKSTTCLCGGNAR